MSGSHAFFPTLQAPPNSPAQGFIVPDDGINLLLFALGSSWANDAEEKKQDEISKPQVKRS